VFCRECGQPISETDKFCENCGAKTARAAPVQSAVVTPAAPAPEVPTQSTVLTSSRFRLVAAIALVGCVLAVVGIFLPWASWTRSYQTPRWYSAPVTQYVSGTNSAWDYIRHGSPVNAHIYQWLVLIGACVALIGALFSLGGQRLKVFWVASVIGSVLAFAGIVWAFADGTNLTGVPAQTHEYGMYLTLAGSIIGVVGGLMGLVMLMDFYRRRVSPTS
jgi:hypothetical protein